MAIVLALVWVLLAAVLEGAGTTSQAIGAARAHGRNVMLQPGYLLGWLFDAAGWLLSVIAMRHLPLMVVQPILAMSLAVTVLLNIRVLSIRPSARVMTSIAAVICAVTVLAISAVGGRPAAPPSWLVYAIVVCLGILVLVTGWLYTIRRPVLSAVVSGLAYSLSAVSARGVHGKAEWESMLTEPLAWMVLGMSVVGAVSYARAVEVAGPKGVTTVTAWLWVVEIVVPSVIGVLVLGDRIRPGWDIPAVAALALAVGATTLLSATAGAGTSRPLRDVDAV